MLLLRALLVLFTLVLWVGSTVDVVRSDASGVRYLHKWIWLLLVLLLPPLGPLGWLLLGRPDPIGSRFIPSERVAAPPPDDSPEFLARLDEEIKRRKRAEDLRRRGQIGRGEVEEEIRRLEQEFEEGPDEAPGDPDR